MRIWQKRSILIKSDDDLEFILAELVFLSLKVDGVDLIASQVDGLEGIIALGEERDEV